MIPGRHKGSCIDLRRCRRDWSGYSEAVLLGRFQCGAARSRSESFRGARKALKAQGYNVAWHSADVGDFGQCEEACARLSEAIGPIDTLIDNAGISPKHDGKPAPIWQMTSTEWQRVVNVNLNGAFNLSRLLSVPMVERRFGRIISMSSVAGSAFLPIVAAHYSATKAAIIGLTRHLAGELGEYGITANALAPGRIEPPLLRTV